MTPISGEDHHPHVRLIVTRMARHSSGVTDELAGGTRSLAVRERRTNWSSPAGTITGQDCPPVACSRREPSLAFPSVSGRVVLLVAISRAYRSSCPPSPCGTAGANGGTHIPPANTFALQSIPRVVDLDDARMRRFRVPVRDVGRRERRQAVVPSRRPLQSLDLGSEHNALAPYREASSTNRVHRASLRIARRVTF
jgi:hypothetical protein